MIKQMICLLALVLLVACSEDPQTEDEQPIAAQTAVADPAPGVALALAEQRAAVIADVRYELLFQIPAGNDEAVKGNLQASFDLLDASMPLVLDFRAPTGSVLNVMLNGQDVAYSVPIDHIVIPAEALQTGALTVTVDFVSTDTALNRQNDFMYALFVPDRASTAFPVFEQPDIKATYTLSLEIPTHWQTIANGAQLAREPINAERDLVSFAETEAISSYLFAFAAGVMQVETAERNGRLLTMYHRETDTDSLARNRDAIFDLHATALTWLEEYTGISYPFGKFAFFAVPAFQFGGMEHPGAIWYRAETLFLDPTASRTQELGRASLIAHETAHMWFGDLVTMRWFNDVWMKEVFANFMAAKIAGPSFPDLNLQQRFFQAHHPVAYSVDRTAGANPIRQQLGNLREAGSLYGAIIYQKAPVVMQQLEALLGESVLRDGLHEYLQRFQFGNATWPDLVAILDARTEQDLESWSRAWVDEPGRPRIETQWTETGIRIRQSDDNELRGLLWNQPIKLAVSVNGEVTEHTVQLVDSEAFLPLELTTAPEFILPGADGIGYARFLLDETSKTALLERVHTLQNPLHRAVTWQTLWEEVLEGTLAASVFMDAAIIAVAQETDELAVQQVLSLLRNAYWRYFSAAGRYELAGRIEPVLWAALERAPTAGRKGAYFNTLLDITMTAEGLDRLQRIWRMEETPEGLPLQEQQYIALAEMLALREIAEAETILDAQEQRISNPDRLARFCFLRPAFSADAQVREQFFNSFADLQNRGQESWVLDAMRAIHHPLRADASLPLVRASLDLVDEIQRTGDIFFPLRWLNATLDGHRSLAAATIVEQFLNENESLPAHLRAKVLQAADPLFRATAVEL